MNEDIIKKINVVHRLHYNKKQREFLERAEEINERDELFSYKDFSMPNNRFRQIKYQLRDEIECIIPSKPAFYKLKKIQVSGVLPDEITNQPTEVGNKAEQLLDSVSKQPAAIHDIKLKFKCTQVHPSLINQGYESHPNNNGIFFDQYQYDSNTTINIAVYKETIVIDIGCTYRPIIYNSTGAAKLLCIVGKVHSDLEKNSMCFDNEILSPLNWTITQYHFNRDAKEEYSGEPFHTTVNDFTHGLIRYYSKKFRDRKTRLRQETIKTPTNSVQDEIEKMRE